MNMKHTAGPWLFRDGNVPMNSHIVDSSGRWICEFDLPDVPFDQIEANAYLIAAAPEMLEALEIVKKGLEGKDINLSELSEQVDSVLCKAKGESHV